MIKLNKPIPDDWINLSKYSNYIAEPKYDGMRALLSQKDQDTKLFRADSGKVKNESYPEILNVSLPDDTIIDGELCILQSELTADFAKILNRQTNDSFRIKLLSKKIPATYMAFDILKFEGQDTTKLKLSERQKLLNKIKPTTNFKIIQQYKPTDLYNQVKKFNMEGIVLKNLNSLYYDKNSWVKMKNEVEHDYIVTGFTSETRIISALELNDFKGTYVGKVNYTGYPSTEEWAKKVVGMIAVVRHMWTNTMKLRFPKLKELRVKQ